MLWGLSPALDLLREYERVHTLPKEGELRILLLGSIDSRHCLQTMACWKRHKSGVRVVFYVLDLAMELVARQMLLLTIALEPPDKLGLHEKARIWMEVYGNTLIRPSTARYLIHKANQLVLMVTNKEYLQRRMPLLDLDSLRYKEKDQLENIFKYWMYNRYSLAKIWDKNLRRNLGTRYDAKLGVFDWDYNMKLLEIQDGKRVCAPEYKHWRNTGIGFTWLEMEYSVGNPTLAVGIGIYGDQLYSHGYMGDMESGPYYAFGTHSEEKQMLETTNGYNVRRATDITERNLQRLFIEIETGSAPSDLYSADIDMGLVMTDQPRVNLEEETNLDYKPDSLPEEYPAIPVNHKVIFLPANALQTFVNKPKYQEFFDMVYVAQNYFKFLSEELLRMVKVNCPVVIETRKFVIAYDKKIGEFEREVKDKMKLLCGKEISKCHYRRHSHALYKVKIVGGEEDKTDDEGSDENENIDLKSNCSGSSSGGIDVSMLENVTMECGDTGSGSDLSEAQKNQCESGVMNSRTELVNILSEVEQPEVSCINEPLDTSCNEEAFSLKRRAE